MAKRFAVWFLCLLLCVPALAEGAYFSDVRFSGMAEAGGQVYGLSGLSGSMGLGLFDPVVERWNAAGQRAGIGQRSALNSEIRSIDAAGDALLIVREEKDWLELLDNTGPIALRADLWYPATGRKVRVDGSTFALQGKLFIQGEDELQQLSADGKTVVAAWPGRIVVDWRPLRWDSFVLMEDGGRRMLLEVASGERYDAENLTLTWDSHAALEDGVLYLLEGIALTALDLTDGVRRELLTFPEETYDAFVLDAEHVVLLGRPHKGDPIESAVYDRATMACTLTFTHMTSPVDALLTDDTLYLRSPYSGAYLGMDEQWSRESSASVIDLTTGDEAYWKLNE